MVAYGGHYDGLYIIFLVKQSNIELYRNRCVPKMGLGNLFGPNVSSNRGRTYPSFASTYPSDLNRYLGYLSIIIIIIIS